jgi:hypothetical protein
VGRAVMGRLAQGGDGLLAWVVAVDDVDSVARRLGTTITTIRRVGLSGRLAGLADALHEPFLPFFISRDPGVPDPGIGGKAGGITWIEVAGEAARLEQWLDFSPCRCESWTARPRYGRSVSASASSGNPLLLSRRRKPLGR